MERHEILEVMAELKLHGMRASFDEIAGKGLARRDELYPLIAGLLQAERTHRQARSISYRIGGAKFPVLKDLDTFVFADTPVDQGEMRELATGAFLDAKRNGIFIGGGPAARRRAFQCASGDGRGRRLCAHVDKLGMSSGGRFCQLRFLKRQLVLPVSIISQ